jgi:hypothetical protein
MAATLSARRCIGGDREIPTRSVAEGLAEVEILRSFVVEEEPHELSPGGARRPSTLETRRSRLSLSVAMNHRH